MSDDYEIVKHPKSDNHAVFFENKYVKSFKSKEAAEEWLAARRFAQLNPLPYHILNNQTIVASFQMKAHRDDLFTYWMNRFCYTDFSKKDDL